VLNCWRRLGFGFFSLEETKHWCVGDGAACTCQARPGTTNWVARILPEQRDASRADAAFSASLRCLNHGCVWWSNFRQKRIRQQSNARDCGKATSGSVNSIFTGNPSLTGIDYEQQKKNNERGQS
jgi:hypothetical protein